MIKSKVLLALLFSLMVLTPKAFVFAAWTFDEQWTNCDAWTIGTGVCTITSGDLNSSSTNNDEIYTDNTYIVSGDDVIFNNVTNSTGTYTFVGLYAGSFGFWRNYPGTDSNGVNNWYVGTYASMYNSGVNATTGLHDLKLHFTSCTSVDAYVDDSLVHTFTGTNYCSQQLNIKRLSGLVDFVQVGVAPTSSPESTTTATSSLMIYNGDIYPTIFFYAIIIFLLSFWVALKS